MPGQRQSINLLEAKGRKNLTKAEIAYRKATEITAPSDKVRPSTQLPKDVKREFNKIAKELKAIGIITNLDISALERFVIAQAMYDKVSIQMLKDMDKDTTDKDATISVDKDMISFQDKLFKQCRASAMDLGLTISSRCKLVMPTPKEVPTENPYARFANKSRS